MSISAPPTLKNVPQGTDLGIGHGLGPRAFGGPAQRSFLWRLNVN